ncbi:Neuronal cell adhesion molecule, partial [Schistosoma japonicum]
YYWTLNGQRINWIKPLTSQMHSNQIINNNQYQLITNKFNLWYFNNQNLSNNELQLGIYQCIAKNTFGQVLSMPMRLELAMVGLVFRFNLTELYWLERNLHILNVNSMQRKNLTYTCIINNSILRIMKTGPDIKLYHPRNSLTTSTTTLTPTSKLMEPIKFHYHSSIKQIVLINESLSLKCILTGNPLPQIRWEFMEEINSGIDNHEDHSKLHQLQQHQYRDVKNGILPDEYGIKLKNSGIELYISSVQLIHHGNYRCSAINVDYIISTSSSYINFNVIVESKPYFAEYPQDTVISAKSSIILRCSINREITKPSATLNWLVNGEPIERYLDGVRKINRNNVLYLYNLTINDSAVFQCVLHNRHGYNIINAYVHVWNQPPAFINVMQNIQYIIENQYIHLPCKTYGAPKAEINWFFNDKEINNDDDDDDYVIDNGDLNILRAKLSHTGKYTCKATNHFGVSQSSGRLFIRKQTLTVVQNNTKRINVKYVMEGSMIHFTCKVETDPLHKEQLKITWRKNNLTLDDSFEHDQRFNVSSLNNESIFIRNLLPNDTGIYMCIASRPQPPKYVKLTCNYKHPLSPYAMLTWQLDEINYATIEKVYITSIKGYYRPIENDYYYSMLTTEKSNDKLDYSNHDHDRDRHHHHLYWLNQSTLLIAQMIVNDALHNNQWSINDLIPEIKIIEYLQSKNSTSLDLLNVTKLPVNIGRAFIQLQPDVLYHFRIELVNSIGKSLPSNIIPELTIDSNELCILPPRPTSINPDYLIVYGNKPNNLIIQWKVTLQAENYLGSSGIKPLIFTGRSGEDIPQLSPIQLKALYIDAKKILLSWKLIKDNDFSMKMNGLFQGFRIEWCIAELSNDSCEFYKKFQDYILEHPPTWSFPNLRRTSTLLESNSLGNDNHLSIDSISSTMSSSQYHENISITFENDLYKAYLNELPGKTKLKIWVRILNIQYAGPESDTIIVETKEGVPEKVTEFTITFIGVNHIEVSWIKPMIINGDLISYDLEIYL